MTSKRTKITEEDNLQENWYVLAGVATLKTLPAFIDILLNEYEHDYGTICHAISAGAIATINAMTNSSEQGHITHNQTSAVIWMLIKKLGHIHGHARILKYHDLLYPAGEMNFKEIPKDVWTWAQKEAKQMLTNGENIYGQSLDFREHLEKICDGVVPFGLTVSAI